MTEAELKKLESYHRVACCSTCSCHTRLCAEVRAGWQRIAELEEEIEDLQLVPELRAALADTEVVEILQG